MTEIDTSEPERSISPYLDYALNPLNRAISNAKACLAAKERLKQLDIGRFAPPPLGIEIPISKPGQGFDLSVGYATGFGNREALNLHSVNESFIHPPSLDDLDGFDNIWLEHDLIAPQTERPSFYFSPDLPKSGEMKTPNRLSARQMNSTVAAAIALAPGLADHAKKQIRNMLESYTGPNAYVLCGVMTGREKATVRLVFRFESVDAAIPFLNRFGYQPHQSGLEWLSGMFGPLMNRVLVGCEIGNPTALGVELYAPDGTLRSDNLDHQMLMQLEREGLCTHEKREALLSYPGRTVITTGQENWGYVEKRDGPAAGSMQIPVCERRFHHFKITLNQGEPVLAKAYMSALFKWWFR